MGFKEKSYTGCLQRIASTSAVFTAASMMGISLAPAVMDAQDVKAGSELISSSTTAGPGDDLQPAKTPGFIGPMQTTVAEQPKRHLYDPARIDVSLGVFPQLTGTRTVENASTNPFGSIVQETTQGTTPSPGVLGTFHQQLTHWIGYETGFGYTRLDENYLTAVGYNGTGGSSGSATSHSISSDVYELSLAVVAKGPVSTHRMQTFIDGGSGVLLFRPNQQVSPERSQIRGMVLFGAGVDYRLSDHLGIRAEYRGMFYKNPDFRNPDIVATKLFTVSNEPTLSLVYRFGTYKRMQ